MQTVQDANDQLSVLLESLTALYTSRGVSDALFHQLCANIEGTNGALEFFDFQHSRCVTAAEIAYSESPPRIEKLSGLLGETKRLSVTINAIYLFLRSLQDNAYKLLLERNKQNWGTFTSIKKAQENQYGQWIQKVVPAYFDWFIRMREIRNIIKSGAVNDGGSFDSKAGAMSVTYVAFEKDGKRTAGYSASVNIDDIRTAVEFSCQLLTAILQLPDENSSVIDG